MPASGASPSARSNAMGKSLSIRTFCEMADRNSLNTITTSSNSPARYPSTISCASCSAREYESDPRMLMVSFLRGPRGRVPPGPGPPGQPLHDLPHVAGVRSRGDDGILRPFELRGGHHLHRLRDLLGAFDAADPFPDRAEVRHGLPLAPLAVIPGRRPGTPRGRRCAAVS